MNLVNSDSRSALDSSLSSDSIDHASIDHASIDHTSIDHTSIDHASIDHASIDWGAVRAFLRQFLRNQIHVKLRGKMDESDIVQMSLVDVQASSETFRLLPPQLAQAWLRRLATNNLIDAHRAFVEAESRDVDREIPLETCAIIDRSIGTPSAVLSRHDMDHDLLRAVSRLTPDNQKLLRLRHQENLEFQQIGSEMGISEQAARKRWNRIVSTLRQDLARRHG
jgi:RNA polymerase sigma-70 factor, ECF subfamily